MGWFKKRANFAYVIKVWPLINIKVLHSVLKWVLTFNISSMKNHMFLTPEFMYESFGILGFFPHNHYFRHNSQKSLLIEFY